MTGEGWHAGAGQGKRQQRHWRYRAPAVSPGLPGAMPIFPLRFWAKATK
jgi:hypothetical protein